jgi:solute:Na+ symporter, SSS family
VLNPIDFVICALYLLAMVWLGLRAGLKGKSSRVGTSGSTEYFLAGKSLRWPTIGLALFATNISCIHLVSLAQSGFDSGLLAGNFEWMAAFTLVLLAVFFIPFYIKSGVTTLPDFLEKRYNRACRDWLTIISIVSAMVIHIAFSLLAGGIVLESLLGINMYISVTGISVLVAVYTIVGGLRAVVVTESVQTVVLVAGALVITIAAWTRLGGWIPLTETLAETGSLTKLSMLRPAGDPDGMPWYAIFLGYPVLGIWYWCADQTIVQRALGAKDQHHAQAGALFCGFIKILPVFLFVLPGLMAYALAEKGLLNLETITTYGSSGEKIVNTKGIYTLMITELLPVGLSGIVVAALLSGLMSQVSGALNSIATLVSFDLVKRSRPGISDKKLVTTGRMAAAISLVISISLLPLLSRYESLFLGLNDVIAHIAPPITCVFLVGVFWRRASGLSAQYTLWVGSLLGVAVFAVGKIYPLSFFGKTPFMMSAFYLFCFCLAFQIALAFIFPFRHTAESRNLYWSSPLAPLRQPGWKGIGNYKVLSMMLITIMAGLYLIFN